MNTAVLLKKAVPHLVAIVAFFAISCLYFFPQLNGKTIRQGDIQSYQAMSQEVRDFQAKTGEKSLWTNAMFGGMPTYQINTITDGNLVNTLKKPGSLFMTGSIGLFILLMLSFYISLVLLGANPWISLFGAIAFGLTTNNLVLYEAGHVTKIKTIAFFAPIVAGLFLSMRKKYWVGGILFGIGLALNLSSNHIQMTYYLLLNLIILGIIWLVNAIRSGEIADFGKTAAILIGIALLALGTTASNYLPTYEYSQETMRGTPILEKDANSSSSQNNAIGSSSEVSGLDWNYAMRWSNGTIDLFSSFIPGVAGGGSAEKVSDGSPLKKDAQWGRVLPSNGNRAPLYWGNLPFTSGPIYFGAIFFFLFLLGLVVEKGTLKWWIGLSVLFTFLLSLGYNASWLNKTLFNYFPLFNKFRTPNSALAIVSFLIPFFSVYVFSNLINKNYEKQQLMKALYATAGGLGVICLFFALVGPGFFSFNSVGDANYVQQGLKVDGLLEARAYLMRMDSLRSLMLIALSAGLIWAYMNDKLQKNIVIGAVAILSLFDIWGVGRRYVDPDDFVNKTQVTNSFSPRQIDQQIMNAENSRGDYRVWDLSINTFNDASTSYFHNTIGGYNAAKLQRAQDIIDRHIMKNNMEVIHMMNGKYIITQQGQVQQNPDARGTAWLVKNLKLVPSANAEIDALTGLNTATDAVIHQEFASYIGDKATYNGEGSIALKDYKPNHLTYNTNTRSAQFAVFSEVWYGPDKGWNAYIDGEPAEFIRANYLLRAMKIPAGSHQVEFKFEPASYATGRMISLICSLLLLGGLIFVSYRSFKNLDLSEPMVETTKSKTPLKKTKSKKKKKKS